MDGTKKTWDDICDQCTTRRPAPMAPDVFEQMIRDGMTRERAQPGTGVRFTNGKDATEVIIPQYTTGFLRLMREAKYIAYVGLHWGDEELCALAGAIRYAHLQGLLKQCAEVKLANNEIGDKGLRALSAELTTGVLPQLTLLVLENNRVGDAGLEALSKAACAGGALLRLEGLLLHNNRIGDAGIKVFSEALATGALRQLDHLDLGGNRIGDAGMQAFSEACAGGALASLCELYLHDNQISDQGMIALAEALDKGALSDCFTLNLGGNLFGEGGMQAFATTVAGGAPVSFSKLFVDEGSMGTGHPGLKAACEARQVELVPHMPPAVPLSAGLLKHPFRLGHVAAVAPTTLPPPLEA